MAGKKKLFEHQLLALGTMSAMPALGVFYDMGTGKTAIALMHIYEQLQKKATLKVIVVCPANMVDGWELSIDELIDFEGVTPAGIKAMHNAITIRSYQKMYKSEVTGSRWYNGKEYKNKELTLRPDINHPWDIMCVDESHCIGAHNSVQSKAAWKLAKLSKTRYLFSGTPVHGGGGKPDYSKLYGQMRVLMPFDWITWKQFMARYVLEVNPRFPSKIERYNEPACRALLENHAIVCRIEDCVDLPGSMDIEVPCKLVEKTVYNDIVNMDVAKYGLDINTGGGKYLRLLQVCSGSLKVDEHQTHVLKTRKDDATLNILTGTDEKIVVFCNFRASVDRVADLCRQAERSYIIVDGRTKDSKEWRQFQYGDVETIICQYFSGGTGLNLYSSHHTIFYEPTPSSLVYTQARKRTDRTGQTQKCINYLMITPGTAEEKSWKTVRQGKDVTDEMMKEWSEQTI